LKVSKVGAAVARPFAKIPPTIHEALCET